MSNFKVQVEAWPPLPPSDAHASAKGSEIVNVLSEPSVICRSLQNAFLMFDADLFQYRI